MSVINVILVTKSTAGIQRDSNLPRLEKSRKCNEKTRKSLVTPSIAFLSREESRKEVRAGRYNTIVEIRRSIKVGRSGLEGTGGGARGVGWDLAEGLARSLRPWMEQGG